MPIKTTLNRCGVPLSIRRTWEMISSAVRSRVKPSRPVRQKVHPRPHPTCEEMQRVERSCRGIRTLSMDSPSSSFRRNFFVPSDEVKHSKGKMGAGRGKFRTEEKFLSAEFFLRPEFPPASSHFPAFLFNIP